jgi:hypothetical protein
LAIVDCLSIIDHFQQIRNAHLRDGRDFSHQIQGHNITDATLLPLLAERENELTSTHNKEAVNNLLLNNCDRPRKNKNHNVVDYKSM